MSRFAPLVLRIGLSALFIWFGLSELLNVSEWTSWVPAWATALIPLKVSTIVILNGSAEVIGGAFLAFGILTRWVSLLLALHLLLIAFDIGFTAIGIRDFALAFSTFALSLFGKDDWSLS